MTDKPSKNLTRYHNITQNKLPAQFKISQNIQTDFHKEDTTNTLWKLHEGAIKKLQDHIKNKTTPENLKQPDKSLLDLKIELAKRNIQQCTLCERACKVNRLKKQTGYCRIDAVSRYAAEFPHTGEEPELIPSHTIFFTGCNFQCTYCQNWDISTTPQLGTPILPEKMAETITKRHFSGSKNVNFVTPTPHTHNILRILKALRINTPVIWNSNMYYTEETAKLLIGVIDIYLADFRYGCDQCATQLSDAPSYTRVVKRNLTIAYREGEILLRHLVLPGHTKCCTENITQWVKQHTPHTRFNLMFQYHPEYKAYQQPLINRCLTIEEKQQAIEYASQLEDVIS